VENTNKGEERRNKKGRIADESDYADYTDFQFNLPPIFPFDLRNTKIREIPPSD
jgi:hypothetical protein